MVQSLSLQDTVDHFRKEEWVAKLIDAPGTTVGMPSSRRPKKDLAGNRIASQDQLFYATLNNDDSIPYMLYFHPEPTEEGTETKEPVLDKPLDGTKFSIPTLSLLMDLREGVKGFTSFAHGGFLGAAIDEAMGTLIFSNYEYQMAKEDAAVKNGGHWRPPPGVLNTNLGIRVLTASMNIRFRRPIVLPSVVVATATLSRFEGRRIFLDVEITDEWGVGKGKAGACTTCEGMWMSLGEPPASGKL